MRAKKVYIDLEIDSFAHKSLSLVLLQVTRLRYEKDHEMDKELVWYAFSWAAL